jgi:hypothetical protein
MAGESTGNVDGPGWQSGEQNMLCILTFPTKEVTGILKDALSTLA